MYHQGHSYTGSRNQLQDMPSTSTTGQAHNNESTLNTNEQSDPLLLHKHHNVYSTEDIDSIHSQQQQQQQQQQYYYANTLGEDYQLIYNSNYSTLQPIHSTIYRNILRTSLLLDLLALATLLGAVIGSGNGSAIILPTIILAVLRIAIFGYIASDIFIVLTRHAHFIILFYWSVILLTGYLLWINKIEFPWTYGVTMGLWAITGIFTIVHTFIYISIYLYLRHYQPYIATITRQSSSSGLLRRRISAHQQQQHLRIDTPAAHYGALSYAAPLKTAVPIAAAAAEAASIASARQRMAASAPILIPQTPSNSSISSRNRSSFATSGRSNHGRSEFSLKRMVDSSIDPMMDNQTNLIEEEEEEEEEDIIQNIQNHIISIGSLPRPTSSIRRSHYINDHWDESVPFSPNIIPDKSLADVPPATNNNHPDVVTAYSLKTTISTNTNTGNHPLSTSVLPVSSISPVEQNTSDRNSLNKLSHPSLSPQSLNHPNGLPVASYSFFRNAYDTPMHSMPSPTLPGSGSMKGYAHLSLTAQLQNNELSPIPPDNANTSIHGNLLAEELSPILPTTTTVVVDSVNSNGHDHMSSISDEEDEYEQHSDGNPDGFLAPMIDLTVNQQQHHQQQSSLSSSNTTSTTTNVSEYNTTSQHNTSQQQQQLIDDTGSMPLNSHYSAKGQVIPQYNKVATQDSPWSNNGMASRSSNGSLKLNPLRRTVGFDIHAQKDAAMIVEELETRRATLVATPQIPNDRSTPIASKKTNGLIQQDIHYNDIHNGQQVAVVAGSLPPAPSHLNKVSPTMLSKSTSPVPSAFPNPPNGNKARLPFRPAAVELAATATALSSSLPASSPIDNGIGRNDHGRMHQYIREAIQAIWNGEFDKATRLLTLRNQIPRMAIHYTEIYLVRLLVGGHLRDREATLEYADITDQLAGRVLDSTSEWEASFQQFIRRNYPQLYRATSNAVPYAATPALRQNYRWDCMLARADALLFRAVLQMLSGGSEIKGAFNLRKSWKLYTRLQTDMDLDEETCRQRVIQPRTAVRSSWYSGIGSFGSTTADGTEADPDLCDALVCGLGVFYFVLSVVPGSFLSILKAIGFSADRSKGIRLLNVVFERGGARAPFAAVLLLFNHLMMPRALQPLATTLQPARQILKLCLEQFPNSPVFLFMAALLERKSDLIHRSMAHLTQAIAGAERARIRPINFRIELGALYLIRLDIASATRLFEMGFYGRRSFSRQNTIKHVSQLPLNAALQVDDHQTEEPANEHQHADYDTTRNSIDKDAITYNRISYRPNEVALQPFSGVVLAACYTATMTEDSQRKALSVMHEVKQLLDQMLSGSTTSSKQKLKPNRFVKFAMYQCERTIQRGRIPVVQIIVLLYLRRDLAHMRPDTLKTMHEFIKQAWEYEVDPDDDTRVIYTFLRGVIYKQLGSNAQLALEAFHTCIQMEPLIEYENWVLPHCRYELGELLAMQLNRPGEAMREFELAMSKGDGKSGYAGHRNGANQPTNERRNGNGGGGAPAYQKYEFSDYLRRRAALAVEQLRNRQHAQ